MARTALSGPIVERMSPEHGPDSTGHRVDTTARGTILRRRLPGAGGLSAIEEAQLLRLLAPLLPLPIPRVLALDEVDDSMELERVHGAPLLGRLTETDLATRTELGAALGGFIAAIASVPADDVSDIVGVDKATPAEILAEATEDAATASRVLGPGGRDALAQLLAEPPPAPATDRVLVHADLGAEHVFVEGDDLAITGIVDWSDAVIGDPALDLGLVLRDLGTGGFAAALDAYAAAGGHADTALVDRALFHARIRAVEDLAYGIEHDASAYRTNAIRALGPLLAPGAGTRVLGVVRGIVSA